MNSIEAAKQLGETILKSDELQNLRKAEAEIEIDSKANILLEDYKNLQIELVRATRGKKDNEVISSLKERLVTKQDELNQYDVTLNYLKAKSAFDSLMKTVNDTITFVVTGKEACSPDKCGSCGGGCK